MPIPVRTPRPRPRHLRLPTLAGALILAVSAVTGAGASGAGAAAAAEPSDRPTLTFADSTTQAKLGAPYAEALTNVLDINTVPYDPAVYNSSGLMTDDPQEFIRAGGGYEQPWTRDAAVNTWNAASLLEPAQAANTLWAAVVKQPDGQLIVQQDNQQWDQVVWMTGAWNHYLVTGDETFLSHAYQVAVNTLDLRRSQDFNSAFGLFQGPSFFNDGIAGYPAPPADDTESHGSFVGDYPDTSSIMALSTNALYFSAYRSAAQMAAALGRPDSEADALDASADTLKEKINQHLWIPDKGMYGYFIHGDDSLSGQLDVTEEGAGLSFAVLFGIADASQARSIMRNAHIQPYGIVDTYPDFARYSDDRPGRHNGVVWPMVQGYWADAAARTGDQARFADEVRALAGLADSSGQFAEIYNARTGEVDGGWQTGSHWDAAPDQAWSATAYLRMIDNGLFGMEFGTDGIDFRPTLPAGWGDVTLNGVSYRDAELDISLHGSGNVISSFTLDGAETSANSVPASLSGKHDVEITLSDAEPRPRTSGGR
ncbi:MGH1-like glycoside hydrolase domain-containing protein [Streptomyces sp. NBC_01012]|uniref:MGH1-like glycoside hydrolase domain-containing protein n=1 Tax=Streptomyces sp. NBC_01012 TaxID=2903717 RepID=UPI0038664425|nr:hypothetical protein OG623_05090 [Streptomyces sp. NBC_01012]